jgi:protein-disulfide isomerase
MNVFPHTARAGLTATASLLLSSLLLATSFAAVAAQGEEPELTWAPLVTPPPVMEPPIWSSTDQVDGFATGSPDAPVTVEVWEDFQCPFCQRFTYEVKPVIVEQYVKTGDVRLVFRNLAFLGDESHWAAVASSLAADQNKFWPFHDYLYANFQGRESGAFRIDRLLEMGEAVGLDMDQFREGLQLENARQRFAEIEAEARRDATAIGVSATPTVTVDGVPLQAPDFESVSAAIDIALAKWRTANEADAQGGPDDSAQPDASAE